MGAIAYMSHGFRRYGEFPVRLQRRRHWEIQCVLKGSARPDPLENGKPKFSAPVLYIFEPMHEHGWTAPACDLSEILVVHLAKGTRAVREIQVDGTATFPLTEIDLLRIKTLFEWMHPHWVDSSEAGGVVLESGGALLADLVRQKLLAPSSPDLDGTPSKNASLRRIENARRYYRENILRNPRVAEVARALGVSSSQLRRIFVNSGQPTPAIVFRSIQMDYARRLLAAAGRSVSEISDDLGFDSPSAFSRSFKNHFGKSPLQFLGGDRSSK